ncbi:LysR family transcriptional regulator [Lacticaseibacillus thailandensis]|uniref:LysR family transcriptional regulator n=1 Tax=Lacticaseibacillus thailandensis DSM 22698 = JCM 13996 TaxID=1423810 RepID=A0A0R2CGC9_9LACO|nr:LysR family transcriptional regulator [Lacticaseibacillus thailandensis]KRM87419.1 LysR family transcriptional regulator [Lacticaseibacillus thailandensis DSM 22698 = JCM 13996]
MELRLLEYFWTVADAGTVSEAARRLHVTQPTVSRQIQALEDELDTQLFDREHNRLTLTEAGVFLRSRAQEILSLTQQTEQAFTDRQRAVMTGNLRIGCVEADNSATMAMMLEEMTAEYPEVTFSITTGDGAIITDQLDKGLVDVAVLLEPVDTTKYESLRLPRVERWGLLMAREAFLATRDVITPQDMGGLPLIMSERPAVRTMLDHWLAGAEPPHIIGHFNLNFNVVPLVERQVGMALSIEGVNRDVDHDRLKFLPLSPTLSTHCVLVWRRNRVLTPLVADYIRRFREAFS